MGYIKLFRSINGRPWADDPYTVALWVQLLLNVNWEDFHWSEGVVERGSIITSLFRLSQMTGISEKCVRTGLERLEKDGKIVKEGTYKWTKITICNFDLYHCPDGDDEDFTPFFQQKQVVEPEKPKAPIKPNVVKAKAPAPKPNPIPVKKPEPIPAPSPTKIQSSANSNAVELEIKRIKEQNIKDSVNRLYKAYPTKCPVNGRPTGKGSKDKRKLESLLRNGMSESELESKIARYISDCIQHQSFMKNFQTFLNNIPDYSEPDLLQAAQQDTSVAEKQTCTIGDIRSWYPKTPDETEDEFNERIDYICKVKERDGITIIYEE